MNPLIQELIAWRKKRGLSQAALAAQMNSNQTLIARTESGRSSPTLATIQKMAAVLGLKITLQEINTNHQ